MKNKKAICLLITMVMVLSLTGCFLMKPAPAPMPTKPVDQTEEDTTPQEEESQTAEGDPLHLSERHHYKDNQDLYHMADVETILAENDAEDCGCDFVSVIGKNRLVLRLFTYGGAEVMEAYERYVVYDLETGKTIGTLYGDAYISVTQGYIIKNNTEKNLVQFYDENLELVKEFDFECPDGTPSFYGGANMLPLYLNNYDEHQVYKIDIEENELVANAIELPGYDNFVMGCSLDGHQIYVNHTESTHFRTESYIYDMDTHQKIGKYNVNQTEWVHDSLEFGEQYVMEVHPLPDTLYYCFTLMDENYKMQLLLWDATEAIKSGNTPDTYEPETNSTQEEDVFVIPEASLTEFQELYDRADGFYQTYGVHLYIADQVPEEISGFHLERLTDVGETLRMMNAIDRILSVYPENFLNQLLNGDVEELDLFITNGVTSNEEGMLPVAGGFATTLDHRRIIVIDLTTDDAMYDKLNHELMHLIETRLTNASNYIPNFEFEKDDWLEYNPVGFEYSNDYPNYADYEPAYEYWDWFVSSYSTVNVGEDMAEIYGAAMYGYFVQDEGVYIDVKERQHLNDKLNFLCDYIRASFDTTGWADVMPWEIFAQ